MSKIIIEILLYLILIVFIIVLYKKGYKSYKDEFSKLLYCLLLNSIIFLLIVYHLDKFNVPSMLGYTKNINSSDWINILTNFFITIISTLLSSIILLKITFKQLEETRKDNIELNNENHRIQNAPLLKYNFTLEHLEGVFTENQKWILINQDDINQHIDALEFVISIENIGLNTARNVILTMESLLFNKKEIFEMFNQSSIEKDQIIKKEIIIPNVQEGTYKIFITVFYQDLLKNWYKQKIELIVSMTNIFDSSVRSYTIINSFNVYEEELTKDIQEILPKT